MKLLLLPLALLMSVLSANAQTSQYISQEERNEASLAASPIKRIGVDFELKDQPNPSVETLAKINLSNIELYRKEDQRAEYFEPQSGLIIVVYTANEATAKKTTMSNPAALPIAKPKNNGGK